MENLFKKFENPAGHFQRVSPGQFYEDYEALCRRILAEAYCPERGLPESVYSRMWLAVGGKTSIPPAMTALDRTVFHHSEPSCNVKNPFVFTDMADPNFMGCLDGLPEEVNKRRERLSATPYFAPQS